MAAAKTHPSRVNPPLWLYALAERTTTQVARDFKLEGSPFAPPLVLSRADRGKLVEARREVVRRLFAAYPRQIAVARVLNVAREYVYNWIYHVREQAKEQVAR